MNVDTITELLALDDDVTPTSASREEAGARLDGLIAAASSSRRPQRVRPRAGRMLIVVLALIVAVVCGASALGVVFDLPDALLSHGIAAPGTTPVVHARETVDGQDWSITTFVRPDGEPCVAVGPFGIQCPFDTQKILARGPLMVETTRERGLAGSDRYTDIGVWGLVNTETVARAELVLSTGERVVLQPDAEGIFQTVLDNNTLATGVLPLEVVAYDASGNVIATQNLSP